MNSEEAIVQNYAASDAACDIDQTGDARQILPRATSAAAASPARITRLERERLFTLTPSDGWNRLATDGFGLCLKPVGGGKAWDCSAQRSRWNAVEIGQAESREDALAAALKCLTNARENVAALPEAARRVSDVALTPVVASGLEQGHPSTAEFPTQR